MVLLFKGVPSSTIGMTRGAVTSFKFLYPTFINRRLENIYIYIYVCIYIYIKLRLIIRRLEYIYIYIIKIDN